MIVGDNSIYPLSPRLNKDTGNITGYTQAGSVSVGGTTVAQLAPDETGSFADVGTGNFNIAPANPSSNAAIGPSENQVLAATSLNSVAQSGTELADAVDPNVTGLLNTFAQSASPNGAAISEPLGPQVSYADVDPVTSTTTTTSSGSSLLPILFLVALAAGAYWFFVLRKHHAKPE
jgi:hypothetical protein